jgi:hypothetical protein
MGTRYVLLIALAGLNTNVHAQNLVLNPGFETYVPDSINQGYGDGDIAKAEHWVNVGSGTPDYCHSDYNYLYPRVPDNEQGTQVPHGGSAYAGIYVFEITTIDNVREYIRTHLTSAMVPKRQYQVSFHASLADHAEFAAGFGASLSVSATNDDFNGWLMLAPEHIHTPGTITDKENWTLVTGTYAAMGGEEYLTIGGFYDDQNSDTMTVGGPYPNAYYYIDDVSVTLIDPTSGIGPEPSAFGSDPYPNPASGMVTLGAPGQTLGPVLLRDALGRTVAMPILHGNSFDVSTVPPGLYQVSFENGGALRTASLVIEAP